MLLLQCKIEFFSLLLLVYWNARDFCGLIFYSVTLSNSPVRASRFLVESLGFSMYTNVICKHDGYTSSFPICIPFIYFTMLIAVVRTSKTILNKSNKSGHPCFVPNLRGNAFCFSHMSMVFTVSLLYMAFIMLMDVPSMPIFWRVFIINWC